MSVATELGKCSAFIKEAYSMLEAAGGTLPTDLNADNLAETIQNTLFPTEKGE